ncbi:MULTISPECIES: transposase [unclassified Microcoleus]
MLIDAGYGNNKNFLQKLEKRKLKYIGRIAKNRKVIIQKGSDEK